MIEPNANRHLHHCASLVNNLNEVSCCNALLPEALAYCGLPRGAYKKASLNLSIESHWWSISARAFTWNLLRLFLHFTAMSPVGVINDSRSGWRPSIRNSFLVSRRSSNRIEGTWSNLPPLPRYPSRNCFKSRTMPHLAVADHHRKQSLPFFWTHSTKQ